MSNSDFARECLDAMNKYRDEHQVEPFAYNKEIEETAQKWADNLAMKKLFQHNPSPMYRDQEMGENIAFFGRKTITGSEVAEYWYSEVANYDFNLNDGPNTGHFTQVVWKGSTEVGIGLSETSDGSWIVVADFYPSGNFMGQNNTHVLPPKSGHNSVQSRNDDNHEGNGVESHGNGVYPHDNASPESEVSTQRQQRTETIGNQTKTTTTETITCRDGSVKVILTEKTEGPPGSVTKTKVTEKITKDGKTSIKTTEMQEHLA